MKHGDVILLTGAGAILAGLGFMYWPLAVIAGGVWLLAAGIHVIAKGDRR